MNLQNTRQIGKVLQLLGPFKKTNSLILRISSNTATNLAVNVFTGPLNDMFKIKMFSIGDGQGCKKFTKANPRKYAVFLEYQNPW